MKKKLNSGARWILSFICCLTLVAIVALTCIRLTLFEESYMIKQIKESNYVDVITSEINASIADIGRASNISPSVFQKTVSTKMTQENIESYIKGIYTEVPFNIRNEEELAQKIQHEIDEYAKSKKLSIKKNDPAVMRLQSETTSVFRKYIEIPYVLIYGRKVMAFKDNLTILIVLTTVIFLLLLIGVLITGKNWWHRRFRMLSSIFSSAGWMLIVLPAYFYFSQTVKRLAIGSESLYRFLTSYVEGFISSFIKAGIILVGIGVVLLIISELARLRHVKTSVRES